ncbi:hypothetical protein GGR58DRAFT_524895 [Xylaria digitata]|nr:hypothetical protein GGR58DRAFT_524895 [Xylaria digitata]
MYEKRAFRAQKYQSERIPKFHSFMKLPLELRARIYFLAMEDADSPRHLVTLRAPTLALLDEKAADGTLGPLWPKSPRTCCVEGAALQSGRCEPLSKRTRSWLQKIQGDSEELFFPYVEMHITPSRCCGGHRNRRGPILVLSLRACGGRLLLDYKSLKNTDFQPGLDQFRRDAETVARDITARHKKHKSFCYEELDAIAKSFRYWPPGAPEFR